MSFTSLRGGLGKILLICLFICLFFSCKSTIIWYDTPHAEYSENLLHSYSIDVDTISYKKFRNIQINDELITTDSKQLVKLSICDKKSIFLTTFKEEDPINFNEQSLGLLNNKLCKKMSNYQRIYSNIDQSGELFVITSDLVMHLRMIDNEVKLLDSFNLSLPADYNLDIGDFSLNPSVVKINNRIYFPIYRKNYDESLKKFYFLATLNLQTKRTSILEVNLPDFYNQVELNFSNHYSLFKHENALGVAFSFQPVIFLIEDSEVLDTISYKSLNDTLHFRINKKDDNITTFMRTDIYKDRYNSFTYNPIKQHYYTVYQNGQKEYRSDGLKNTIEDRRCNFLIFNSSFEIIADIPLPKGVYDSKTIYPTGSGAFFLASTSEEYNAIYPIDYQCIKIKY